MFRDVSQPAKSNKPTPTVCVIRFLLVMPPTFPEARQHKAPLAMPPFTDGRPYTMGRSLARVLFASSEGGFRPTSLTTGPGATSRFPGGVAPATPTEADSDAHARRRHAPRLAS